MRIKKILSVLLISALLLGCIPTVVGAASNEQTVYEYLKKNLTEMNSAAICGMMAGIQSESNFNPIAKYTEADGSESFGICQWNGGRRTALENFCKNNSLEVTALTSQLKYLEHELKNTSENSAYQLICSVTDNQNGAYKAGYYCARYYERCAEKYHTQRAELARDIYWPKYGTSTPEADIQYTSVECGVSYYIKNVSTGKYLSVDSASDENKINISVAAISDSSAKRFIMNLESEGYCIKPEFTSETVVNVYGTIVKSGCNVCLWSRSGDSSQHFNFEKDGNCFVIRNVQNKNCVLDVSGTNVLVNTYSSSSTSQKWVLIPNKSPEKPIVAASATTDGEKTVIEWNNAKFADKYNVTVKNLSTGKTEASLTETTLTKYEVQLKAGNYSVTVTALNTLLPLNYESKGKTASDPYNFTVEPTHIHSFTGKVEYIIEPTCTESGTAKYYCSCETCEEYIEQSAPPLTHSYTGTPTESLAPTCTEYGTLIINCDREGCDSFIEFDVEPTGHSYDGNTVRAVEPTCTTDGVLKTYCSNEGCDGFTESPIRAEGHIYNDSVVSPTYGMRGYTRHTCINCDDYYDDTYTDALEIYYGDADANGSINLKDVLLIRKAVAGLEVGDSYDADRADADASSTVALRDVLLVRKYVAGLISVFPPDEK